MPSSGAVELPPCKVAKRPPVLTPGPLPAPQPPEQITCGVGISSGAASCSGSSSPLMVESAWGQDNVGEGSRGNAQTSVDHTHTSTQLCDNQEEEEGKALLPQNPELLPKPPPEGDKKL